MSGFAASFWSSDYAGGLGVLFGKLQQGVRENQQILTIARMRADAEDLYGQRLADIGPATDRITGGFSKDDGASTRKAYEGVRNEMDESARSHRKIASNIRELVVNPFGRWCDAHAGRVQNSQDVLMGHVKLHDRQAEAVKKFRSQYYNKCRQLEDLEEEDKLAFRDQGEAVQTPKAQNVPTVKILEPDEEEEPIDVGDEIYQPEQVKKILTHMLENIRLTETKVPILGTYHNVSTGAEITEYIQKHLNATSVSYAERIGQDLVSHGFLRLVGSVGNTFANSSKLFYQWRPKVFQLTGVPDKKKPLERTPTVMSTDSFNADSPVGAVGEYLAGWNPLNNPHPNETPAERLRREAREADERYKAAVRKLDAIRCTLEEAMTDHLKYMERCELDRLKAIKAVVLDFSGAISNVIPTLQSTVDNMMLFQETIQPAGDLRYLLENYRTGPFQPKAQIYENYYNSVDDQTFGVDLEARARADRKRVPLIVTNILQFLDSHYPILEGDEARRGIWLVDVPLAATHHLRAAINNGKAPPYEVLDKYEIPIVASVLKLYLLELPDSLVSSHVYEIVKTIYSTTAPEVSEETRISVIQSTLGQLRLANIATLDAITTHFTRLIELTSADEAYVSAVSQNLAPCILRPRVESSLTLNERYSYRLLRDLFAHKEAIFGELKRASSLAHTNSGASRARSVSTDESNRRAHMEERARAIASRSRATSPAPGTRPPTQRDRSPGPATRFPINTSPTDRRGTAGVRQALAPGGGADGAPGAAADANANTAPAANSTYGVPSGRPAVTPFIADLTRRLTDTAASTAGLAEQGASSGSYKHASAPAGAPPVDTSAGASNPQHPPQQQQEAAAPQSATVDKSNSLGRSGARVARKPGALARQSLLGQKRDSVGSVHEHDGAGAAGHRPVGVELVDRPMDD